MIKAFFKNSFIYTLGTVFTRGVGILLVPIYTRYLSPSEYGTIDLFMIVASIVSLTIALEIHQAVVRFYQDADCEKEKAEYVSTAFMFTIIVYTLYLLISIIFKEIFTIWLLDEIVYENIFLLATISIFTKGLFYFTHGQLKWQILPRKFVSVSIIQAVVMAFVAIYLLVIMDMKLESIFIGQIFGNVTGMIVSIYYTKQSYQVLFVFEKFKEMVSFSFPFVFSGVAVFIALFIDRIAIKYFLGLEELGVYGIAYRFASIASLVMVGFQSSLTPLIYKHYKEHRTPNDIAGLFTWFCIFAIFTTSFVFLFSKEVLILMTTEKYFNASILMMPMVLAVFFANMYIFSPGLAIAKKTKTIMLISITSAVLNTFLNVIMIPILGTMGAALATLMTAVLIFMLRVRLSQVYYYVPYDWKRIIMLFVLIVVSSYIMISFFEEVSLDNIIIKLIYLGAIVMFVIHAFIGYGNMNKFFKKQNIQ